MSVGKVEPLRETLDVRLDSRQVFFLFFGGAIVACMVFALGVMVGRRLEARSGRNERAAMVAAAPLPQLDQMGAAEEDELMFHNTLASGETSPDPLAKPKPGARPAPAPLAAAKPAPEAAKPMPVAGAKPSTPGEPVAGKPAPAPAPAAKPTPAVAAKPSPAAPVAPAVKPAPAPAIEAAAAPKSDGKRYTLQVQSFQSKAEADALIAKLGGSGFAARLLTVVTPDNVTWYRVRMGDYDSKDAALTAKADFERRQHMIAYVTRTN